MASFTANSQTKLYLTVNDVTKTATMVKNEATDELISLLEKGPVTLSLTDNGGFEKIGDLPQSLTTSDERQTAVSGDIMLYIGKVICFFYGSNTWAYTKLGTLDNMNSSQIKEFLKGNTIKMTLSVENEAGIVENNVSDLNHGKIYDLNGNLVNHRPLLSGLYIVDGKKTLIK